MCKAFLFKETITEVLMMHITKCYPLIIPIMLSITFFVCPVMSKEILVLVHLKEELLGHDTKGFLCWACSQV